MSKKYITTILIFFFLSAPGAVFALEMPQSGNQLAEMSGVNAQAYVVRDAATGEVLISSNPDLAWTPASLTKLITALVVLDSQVKLTKVITMTADDQTAGDCTSGGACIKSKAGVQFTVDALFHAALLPSANNAANALARSTGLSTSDFAQKMNEKAVTLGATNTHFNEPTGLDPANKTTAGDYAKIIAAAYSNSYLRGIAALQNYYLRSSNNSKYNQTIKNTDKLLADQDITMIGAKTGYLNESKYNFAALLKNADGQQLSVVVLGEQHLYSAFAETKLLAGLAEEAKALAMWNQPSVLGTTTQLSLTNN